MELDELDRRVAELAERDRELAVSILREAIRIPADHVDRPAEAGGDPLCGLSNHEGPRLEYLRREIVRIGAVVSEKHVEFDEYGNLHWSVEDPDDDMPRALKRVVLLDGHTDTVRALRPQWLEKIGGGIDAYLGLTDPGRVDRAFLRRELGYLPPDGEWQHLVFGRGSADQLAGVVSQILATRILLELAPLGSLRGVIVRCMGTVAEEDNDGGGPMYLVDRLLPGATPDMVPDVVILTEGTGDSRKGALGIYRGQRGRMQIEVVVSGRSCHGSMPWEGLNPLEHGAAILVEAARAYEAREGFLDDPFLGHGTRTASWAQLETPSDCAVPERFTFRFDRRLTVGETAEDALAAVEGLAAVTAARGAGLRVDIRVPGYDEPTWRGFRLGNQQIYPGWATPPEHPAVTTAVDVYRRVVSPHVSEPEGGATAGALRREPRVDRWVFSTDGVGYPVPVDAMGFEVAERKRWVVSGSVKHPAMFGIGAGVEQNTHKIGENVDARELVHAIAFLARFPSAFAAS
jgi:putative selenium metabolism hydrolase